MTQEAFMQTCSNPIGIEAVYAENHRRAIEAAQLRKEQRTQRLTRKLAETIPERYQEAAITNSVCIEWLAGYERGERRNLVLIGEVGTGKTFHTYALAAHLLRGGTNCNVYTAPGFLRHIKEAYNGAFSEAEVMEQLQGIDVLGLDDIGKEHVTPWAVEKLFDVLDARTANRKPVIATTNCSASELLKRYGESGEAILSRLCGGALIARFTGADMRLKQQN